jgi:hypothetical protein
MLLPMLAVALLQLPPRQGSGAILYASCREALHIQAEPDHRSTEEVLIATHCTSYISGFVDASATDPSLCLTPLARANMFVRIYVAYMDAHPGEMNADQGVGLYNALKATYTCPAKK